MPDTSPAQYRFKAIDLATGQQRRGEMSGESAYAVRANLRRIGLEVEELVATRTAAEEGQPGALRRLLHARTRNGNRLAKAELCDALATMLQVGITLEQGLGSLAESRHKRAVERRLAIDLRDRIRDGDAFSAACRRHPQWFDRLDIALIEAGEHAGELTSTLADLASQHQRASALADKLLVALAYPAMLLLVGLAALEIMSQSTLPRLIDMLTQARRPIPWLTEALVATGQGLAHWWPVAIAAGVAVAVAGRWAVGRLPDTGWLASALASNPLTRSRNHARVAHLAAALARLRKAGIGMGEAVIIAAETTDDRVLRKLLADASAILKRGGDLSEAFESNHILDAEFVQFLRLGERSGELTSILERIAERSRRAAERTNERLAAISGPLAIMVLALLIGILVVACALPIAQLGDLI
jgi:general secretion pathway protein F